MMAIMTNSEKALKYIDQGATVGLGTGQAANDFLRLLGKAVAAGLNIRGVPTSRKSASFARDLKIPIATLEEVGGVIDVTVDGTDEVDRDLNLIKGLGGALVREKIVAAASRRLVILIGPKDVSLKDTGVLGKRGVLPVEVVPFGVALCLRRLSELGCPAAIRLHDGQPFVSDNGNYVLDCKVSPIADPQKLEQQLRGLPGLVGTGLFLGMANVVLIQDGDRLEVRER
jgi:ribose 5-phosphate isomerase A